MSYNILADEANKYIGMGSRQICSLKKAGISPEIANPFGDEVPPEDILFYLENNVPAAFVVPFYETKLEEDSQKNRTRVLMRPVQYPTKANGIVKREDIVKLKMRDWSAEKIAQYPRHIYFDEILHFIEEGVEPTDPGIVAFDARIKEAIQSGYGQYRSNYEEYGNQYDLTLNGKTIVALMKMDIVIYNGKNYEGKEDPALKRFGKEGIETLVANGIPPRERYFSSASRNALQFPEELNVEEIIALSQFGINRYFFCNDYNQ